MKLPSFILSLGTLRSIIRIFPRAFQGYSVRILTLAFLGFFAGLLEGIGITALIPLFNFFDGEERQPTDFISRTIEQLFTFLHLPFSLPSVLLFIIILFFLKFVFTVLYSYIAIRIQSGYERMTMDRLLKATLAADWPHLLKQKLGQLETLIKIDVPRSGGMLQAVSMFIMLCASLLAYLLIAINISKTVTLIAFVFGSIVILLYKPLFSFARSLSNQISMLNVSIAHHINESIVGMKTIKALGAEKQVGLIGEQFFDRIRKLQLWLTVLRKITTESIQPLGVIFITGIIAFAFYRTSYNLGALAALIYLINRIFQYTQSVQSVLHDASSTLPYVENVTSYLEEAERAKEIRHAEGELPFHFNNLLSFQSVSFSYPNGRRALSSLSFDIKKGEMVGFIGPSGAGKTTVFDLLLRFLQPTSGKISIDGNDIRSITMPDWRKNISYVSQDVFILNDSVFNNIKFFDEAVTREAAERAAKMAQIYEFVDSLPEKFDTIVGERGGFLSAGQRQRIALARALARKPKVLLLDEATSALDNESEKKIQEAIDGLKGEITILVIAHRLSTVLSADKLLVLEESKITEEGNPRELLKDKDTYFYKVYNLRQ
jgi:ABC-type multidrug transport system fused ATPase/permease subunit